jgi:alpha-tubulin suppressor-like RCC1 family protein
MYHQKVDTPQKLRYNILIKAKTKIQISNMKHKKSWFKLFSTPNFLLILLSIGLLSFTSFNLYNKNGGVNFSSKAFIPNSWAVYGDNSNGQFCNGNTTSSTTPAQLQNSGDIIAISGGYNHVLALKNDNTVKACGDNASGQIGDGTLADKTSFTNVSILSNISQVIAGNQISYALTNTGNVYQWGATVSGNLSTPVLISGLNNIVKIVVSEKTLLARSSTSQVYAYGANASGESGNGNQSQIVVPVIVETGVSDIACSKQSCAVVKSGGVYTAGKNTKKELADGTLTIRNSFGVVNTQNLPNLALANIVSVASGSNGYYYSALDSFGNVWTWGDANFLGYALPGNIDGEVAAKISSLSNITEISGASPLALRAGGNLYSWTNSIPSQITSVTNVTKINSASAQTVYIKGDIYNPIETADIAGLSVACNPAIVSQTTTCTFNLPTNKDLPNSLIMSIGNATPAGNCSGSVTVTCINVPVGTFSGVSTIYISIGSAQKVATLLPTTVSKTIVSDSNIAFQSGTCIPTTINQGGETSCSFALIGSSSFDLPINGLRAAITNTTGSPGSLIGPSGSCTINTTTLTCNNIPTLFGSNIATLGSHEVIVYEPTTTNYFYNKAVISVNSIQINNTNISTSSDCLDTTVVQIGNTYNCTFGLSGSPSNFYILPTTGIVVHTSTTSSDSPLCTILNNGTPNVKLSCNNIPTNGSPRGIQNVSMRIGSGVYIDKGGISIQDNLNNGDLGNLNINCANSIINSVTTCTFNLPSFIGFANLSLSVGDIGTAGSCSVLGNTVSCSNVPTGQDKGNQVIYAQIQGNSRVNTGRTAQLSKVFDNPSVPATTFSCQTGSINSITNCTFSLPEFEVLDPAFSMKIGVGNSVSGCTTVGQTVTCNGVNTGPDTGDQVIYAGTSTQVNTGETVALTRTLTQQDLSNFSQFVNLVCSPNPVAILSKTSCGGVLPSYIVSTNSSISLKLSGLATVNCNINGQNITCLNLDTGTVPGEVNVQVILNNGQLYDTGLKVTVSNKVISEVEIANLGDPSKPQILSKFNCGTNGIVYAGKPTTCTIEVASGWVIYPTLKLGIEVNPTGPCAQLGNLVTCTQVPVKEDTSTPGVLFIVNKTGETGFVGVVFRVQAAPSNFVAPVDPVIPGTNIPISTPSSPSTPAPTPPAGANGNSPAIKSVTETTRSGGFNVFAVVSLLFVWMVLFYKIFIKKNFK